MKYGIEGKERNGGECTPHSTALLCSVLPSLVCIYRTIRSPDGLDTITTIDSPLTPFHCLTSVSSLSFSLPLLSLPTRSQIKKLNWTQAELVQASINYATSLGEREIAGHYSAYTERERQPTLSSLCTPYSPSELLLCPIDALDFHLRLYHPPTPLLLVSYTALSLLPVLSHKDWLRSPLSLNALSARWD